jgi:hypothetical protein
MPGSLELAQDLRGWFIRQARQRNAARIPIISSNNKGTTCSTRSTRRTPARRSCRCCSRSFRPRSPARKEADDEQPFFRKLTREIGETDADSGRRHATETVYEYGAEVDGVFVRIGTFTEGQVADARNRADAERSAAGQQASQSQSQSQSSGGSEPPNEETPASEARTSADAG